MIVLTDPLNSSRPLPLPAPLQLLPFLTPLSLSLSRLLPGTWSYRGVSKQLPLTQVIGINFAINTICFSFLSLLHSRTFLQHSLPKNAHSFLPGNLSKKPLFPLFPLLQFFIFLYEPWPCQLFISKDLNHPANPIMLYPWFYVGKGDMALNNSRLQLSSWISPTFKFKFKLFNFLHLLEVVVI